MHPYKCIYIRIRYIYSVIKTFFLNTNIYIYIYIYIIGNERFFATLSLSDIFSFEEFDISLELVVGVSAVDILGDCDRSTVVTVEGEHKRQQLPNRVATPIHGMGYLIVST